MTVPLRVLAVDMGTGEGGASRSLSFSLRALDRALIQPTLWYREGQAIPRFYDGTGIACRPAPALPSLRALPTWSRNVVEFWRAFRAYRCAGALFDRLAAEIAGNFDLVHLNHEGLFLVARALKARLDVPVTMHMRTNCWDTPFARWEMRETSRAVDHFVFITENERATFARLGGTGRGTVIYNIAPSFLPPPQPDPRVPQDGRFKVASLNAYSWLRGLDRLVDVAAELARRGRRDVLFVMAGRMNLPPSTPGSLGRIGRRGGTLEDYARERGVADMFLFLGHVAEPERVLIACDMLAKPTRESNPWGRDIIESLAAGKPVLAVGEWDGYVTTNETGILHPDFDAGEWADDIVRLADDPALPRRMGEAGRTRIARLCDGRARARDLADVWLKVAGRA